MLRCGGKRAPKNVFEGFSDEVFQSYQTLRAAYETSSRPLYDMPRWRARHVHLKEVADCNQVLTRALLVKLIRPPCDLRGWKAVARRIGATVFLAKVVDTAAAGVRADQRVLWSGLRFLEVMRTVRTPSRWLSSPVSLFTPCGTRLSLLVVSGVEVAAVVGPRRDAAVVGHGLYAVEGEFATPRTANLFLLHVLSIRPLEVSFLAHVSCAGNTSKGQNSNS